MASSTFRVGDRLLGVRSDTYDVDTRLQTALDAHVHHGPLVGSNYSIRLHDEPRGATVPLKRLYCGGTLQLASRSGARVVDALLAHLSSWALDDDVSLVVVAAVAAVGHGRALLLPPEFAGHLPVLERRLARAGFSLTDWPDARIEPTSGLLVVPRCPLDVDEQPLADLRALGRRPDAEGAPVDVGTYPIVCRATIGTSPGAPTHPALEDVPHLGVPDKPAAAVHAVLSAIDA